jgi:hypothetical protein
MYPTLNVTAGTRCIPLVSLEFPHCQRENSSKPNDFLGLLAIGSRFACHDFSYVKLLTQSRSLCYISSDSVFLILILATSSFQAS